jgi:putative flavoprotein involved in K+ transport
VSLQWLASRGAVLVGRIRAVEGSALLLDDTVADCIRFGDERSAEASRQMDEGIQRAGLPLPPLEDDPADEPHRDPDSVRSPERLDLAAAGIGTVIWATGVGAPSGGSWGPWAPTASRSTSGAWRQPRACSTSGSHG